MKISTSILNALDRRQCVFKLNSTNTSYVHIDVMDGVFVDNVQFSSYEEIYNICLVSDKLLDVHLMVEDPIKYVEKLVGLNIKFVTFHLEIGKDVLEIIRMIHKMGYKAGLAIKPSTDVALLIPFLSEVDLVLVMSVEPGYGGQKFIEGTIDRINDVRNLIGNRDILVEVDGGVNDTNIGKLRDVDIAVVGSYIINGDDINERVDNLLRIK